MRVHLKTLGCRLNEAETESWASEFQRLGHRVVEDEQHSDLVVLNTCAVTHNAARKSRQLIRRVQRHNPHAKLVVSGCYASLSPDEVTAIGGIDLLLENRQKSQLVDLATRQLGIETMPVTAMEPAETALFARGRQRAFIKVQDGCRYRCTFCIVTHARGDEQSRTIDAVVQEINTLHDQGISECILTGVHLGGYGSDLDTNLVALIQAVLERTDMPRLRLGSLEPWDIPEQFFELFENPRLMPHLHLPLQSGCDSVLRRMARRCKTADFSSLVSQLRQVAPHFHVTTDVIVGFPGETDAEWQQSVDFIQQVGFADLHIFAYSKRDGTKAACLPDQVDETVKKSRSQSLHVIARQMQQIHLQGMIGRTQPILWEEQPVDGGPLQGYTPNYSRVHLAASVSGDWMNQIIPVKLVGLSQSGDALIAEPV